MNRLLQRMTLVKNPKSFLLLMVLSLLLAVSSVSFSREVVFSQYSYAFVDKDVAAFPKVKDAIGVFQLVTHGCSGELLINGEWKNAKQIAEWLSANGIQHSANKPTADSRQPTAVTHLNIYGCEFAKGAKGLEAVAYLEKTLGVSVSASTNITGKGGDWNLEVGQPIAVISLPNYQGNLQTCCVNEYMQNGSFEQYKNCSDYTVGSFIQAAPTHWSGTSDPELMVVNPITGCNAPAPAYSANWPAAGALSGGQQGYAWAGAHGAEKLTDTLACTLPAGTYTLTFWAGYVVNGPYTTGSPLTMYNSAGTVLGSSATVNNILSPSNQTWKQYSITFTTTTPTNTLGFQVTGGASYLYLDNFSLLNGTPLTFVSGVTGTTAVSNTCPTSTVNLNNYITGTCNNGYVLTWFGTQNSATSYSNPVATPTAVGTSGTYYATCYNATSNCTIQQNTIGLKVNIVNCCAAGATQPSVTKN